VTRYAHPGVATTYDRRVQDVTAPRPTAASLKRMETRSVGLRKLHSRTHSPHSVNPFVFCVQSKVSKSIYCMASLRLVGGGAGGA
jgi:hypothetical protein